MKRLRVTRRVELPDRFRIERCRRAPGFGPRILFFSGGSALRSTSRVLKNLSHNTSHIITSFDSGGSSAKLRECFGMLSIGDLRNRLLALADDSVKGNPQTYRVFAHRLPVEADSKELQKVLQSFVDGRDPLVADLPDSMARIIRTHLRSFTEHIEDRPFDLRGASLGNLVLAAGYLDNERHIDSVIFLFSRIVNALGRVSPVSQEDVHLEAELEDGSLVRGQHRFGGKSGETVAHPIRRLRLIESLDSGVRADVAIDPRLAEWIDEADLICYPIGSFYSSVIANLLPKGVGQAVTGAECPRVYIPNTGKDPEQLGHSVADCVEKIIDYLQQDAPDARPDHLLNFVLMHTDSSVYTQDPEKNRIRNLGVDIIETDLVGEGGGPKLDPVLVSQALVSLA